MSGAIRIVARGMCCAVGHTAPAAIAAIRARMNHFRDTQFVGPGGFPLVGAQLHEVDCWGARRLRLMLDSVLAECMPGPPRQSPMAVVPLLLLLGESTRPGADHRWADEAFGARPGLPDFLAHPASAIYTTGKAGIADVLLDARRLLWGNTPDAPRQVVIAGVDSLLSAGSIGHFLRQERLLCNDNTDGFIPGEAAAAIVLTKAAEKTPGLWIDGIAKAREVASPGGELPQRADGLSAAMREAARDAGCRIADLAFHASGMSGESAYAKELALALARALEVRVADFPHQLIARSVGETGAACGPLTLAWLAGVMGRADGPGPSALLHFANDDGARAALVVRYRT